MLLIRSNVNGFILLGVRECRRMKRRIAKLRIGAYTYRRFVAAGRVELRRCVELLVTDLTMPRSARKLDHLSNTKVVRNRKQNGKNIE